MRIKTKKINKYSKQIHNKIINNNKINIKIIKKFKMFFWTLKRRI
jgi:hypothetical protein